MHGPTNKSTHITNPSSFNYAVYFLCKELWDMWDIPIILCKKLDQQLISESKYTYLNLFQLKLILVDNNIYTLFSHFDLF